MNIAGLRIRITIQRNDTVTDEYGNHKSMWTDCFTCWATPSGSSSGSENEETGHTVEAESLDFTVRYCSETAVVTAKGYRIVLGDRIYNITHVDDMGFRHNSRKFQTMRVER